MKQKFEFSEYIAAIDRELAKRATAYPKKLAKMLKSGVTEEEYFSTVFCQNRQNERLNKASLIIGNPSVLIAEEFKMVALHELTREYVLRKRLYPRWVKLRRIDDVTAEYELAVWRAMTFEFAKQHFNLDVLPALTRRGKPIAL